MAIGDYKNGGINPNGMYSKKKKKKVGKKKATAKKAMPSMSNKGGAVRGKARAAAVGGLKKKVAAKKAMPSVSNKGGALRGKAMAAVAKAYDGASKKVAMKKQPSMSMAKKSRGRG